MARSVITGLLLLLALGSEALGETGVVTPASSAAVKAQFASPSRHYSSRRYGYGTTGSPKSRFAGPCATWPAKRSSKRSCIHGRA